MTYGREIGKLPFYMGEMFCIIFLYKLVILGATGPTGTTGPARRTTVAVAHVPSSAASGNGPAGGTRIQYGGTTATLVTSGPLPTVTQIKLLSAEQEDALIQKCEDNIKKGQFNSTIKEIKPIVLNYRSRNLKFHRKDTIVSFKFQKKIFFRHVEILFFSLNFYKSFNFLDEKLKILPNIEIFRLFFL